MKKILLLGVVLFVAFILSACQTTDITSNITTDIATDTSSQTPIRSIPVDVINSYITPQALTPAAVDINQGNLFDNGGFESGLTGWTGCEAGAIALSADAYEGTKALKVNAGNCFYRSVEVSAAQELILSCYARLESGSGWTGIGLGFADASWTTIPGGPSTIITGNSYQRYDIEATAPAGSKYVSMWMYSDNPALVDECSLMLELAPPPPPPGNGENLLENSNFSVSNNTDNWTVGCGGTTSVRSNLDGIILTGGCLDQSLSASDIAQLKGKDYTYSCSGLNRLSGGYASMTIFLDGTPETVVIPNSTSFDTWELKGTAGNNISSGFVSIYANQNIDLAECSLSVDGSDPPSNGENLVDNGGFENLDALNKPINWTKGCGGTWNSVAGRNGKGLNLQGGVCVDQTLNSTDLNTLSGKDYTYSCYAKNTGGYASMTIFLNGQPKSVVIPASSSYQLVELQGSATQLNSGFISIYSEAGLTVDDCKLEVEGSGPQPGTQQWFKRFGTQDSQNYIQEYVDAVALSSTGVFTASQVIKTIGTPNTFSLDIRKYSRDGSIVFSNAEDLSGILRDAATDSAGNLYVIREITRPAVNPPYRELDIWLHKYNPSGVKLFEKKIVATTYYGGNSSGVLYFDEMTIVADSIYLNSRRDVRKFDLSGTEQWVTPVSSYGSGGLAATTDGSVYVSDSGFRSFNTTLTKLNSDGTQAWRKTINTTDLNSGMVPTTSLVADSNHVYVMGGTVNTLSNDSDDRTDGYLWKYDSNGNEIWTSQYATNLNDRLSSADLYGGALYATGVTGTQGFIKKINLNTGTEDWSIDLDVDGYDSFNDIAVDSTGIYAGGSVASIATSGNNTPIANSSDAFVTKYSLP